MRTSKSSDSNLGLPVEFIARRIYVIRGCKVMLAQDLAELYHVPVKILNQAVKRNLERFPEDFMFQLDNEEFENLKSQFVTSSWGGLRRAFPFAFTEQGIAMLSSVLRSGRAVQVNIAIMRAFVQLRKALVSRADLNEALSDIKKDNSGKFAVVFKALDKLFEKPEPKKSKIGFKEKN